MVTDMVRFANVVKVAREKLSPEIVAEIEGLEADLVADKQKRKRTPRPPAPAGGISICEASRKYVIHHQTISTWKKNGWIPVIRNTGYEKFIDEARVAQLAEIYRAHPGRGSWGVKRFIDQERNS